MGELVYTATEQRRDGIVGMDHGRMPTDTKVTVWADPNKVCIAQSTMVVGVPRGEAHKDKRYYKWITTVSSGFRRNRAGRPQPFYAYRSWDATRSTPWRHAMADPAFQYLGDRSTEVGEVFTHEMRRAFGAGSLHEMYPIAGMYDLPSYRHIPFAIRPAMKENDWAGFVTNAFGKTRATPRLIAAVAKAEPYFVAYAHQFRGLVPNPMIESFIETQEFDDEMEEGFRLHNPNVRKLLMTMNEESRKAILSRGVDLSDTYRIMNYGGTWQRRAIKPDKLYTSWSEVSSS